MARKKKEAPIEPQIEAKSQPPIEPKVDYSKLWFAERIGTKVNAVLGNDITKNPVLYQSVVGPFQTKEECLVAVEKKQAEIDKQIKKFKAIAAAEPEPEVFSTNPKKIPPSSKEGIIKV